MPFLSLVFIWSVVVHMGQPCYSSSVDREVIKHSPTERSSLITKYKFFAPAQYNSATQDLTAKLHSQTIRNRTHSNVEVNIAPFSTGGYRNRVRKPSPTKYLIFTDCVPTFEQSLQSSLLSTRNGNLRSVRLYFLIWWLCLVHTVSIQFNFKFCR